MNKARRETPAKSAADVVDSVNLDTNISSSF